MNDLDVLMMALLVLSPKELNDCFLRAHDRLTLDDQELIGDAGEKLQIATRGQVPEAEEALGAIGMLALHIVTGGPRLVHNQPA